jgi:ppGpp synthetase/RelA/SpoT-type nucleotidyltranferase
MPTTLKELVDAEHTRVQDLHTELLMASAVEDELKNRSGGRKVILENSTIVAMVVEHRRGLTRRIAGWLRSVCASGGFLDRIAADHVAELHALPKTEKHRLAAVERTMRERFSARFPNGIEGVATQQDIELIRQSLVASASEILAHSDGVQKSIDSGEQEPKPLPLSSLSAFLSEVKELINDLERATDGSVFLFSDHLAHPGPEDVARDLIDITLLGTIDAMLMFTGVNDRLGATGSWWWQDREAFWSALSRKAEEAGSDVPLNDRALVESVAERLETQPLTTPQIERLVGRYLLEYARYEATARTVEDRLRRVLGRERIKALISSRAKDPESLRGKLDRKRAKYHFRDLDANLGSVVTDLSGVRVILYDDEQLDVVVDLIKQNWQLVSDETHKTEYKARHITIRLKELEQRSVDGALCEIQITALASHAFNELEHDIGYKDQDVPAGTNVLDLLGVVRNTTETMQAAVRALLKARKEELSVRKTAVSTAMDLGAVLDRALGRRATGDFEALLWLWQGISPTPLTRDLLERAAPTLMERYSGGELDDATRLALALSFDAPDEVLDMARDYADQDSGVIRAILKRFGSK